jgi:hypothetical protein
MNVVAAADVLIAGESVAARDVDQSYDQVRRLVVVVQKHEAALA